MSRVIRGFKAENGWRQKIGWKTGSWKQIETTKKAKLPCNSLHVLTLNVWFDNIFQNERFSASIATIEQLLPDLVALQEVTDMFFELLTRSKKIQRAYYLSDYKATKGKSWYGILILVKKSPSFELKDFQLLVLPSKCDRVCVTATIQSGQNTIIFGTCHLESDSNDWPIRQEQLNMITKHMRDGISIFCGDFNIHDDAIETEFAKNLGWKDVWLLSEGTSEFRTQKDIDRGGHTFGPYGFRKYPSSRLDRILIRDHLIPSTLESFGDYLLDIPEFQVHPSDHLGIHCKLNISN
jgi:endonuclease/exonuclease/phosphatase family metal-dependent hydrolase